MISIGTVYDGVHSGKNAGALINQLVELSIARKYDPVEGNTHVLQCKYGVNTEMIFTAASEPNLGVRSLSTDVRDQGSLEAVESRSSAKSVKSLAPCAGVLCIGAGLAGIMPL